MTALCSAAASSRGVIVAVLVGLALAGLLIVVVPNPLLLLPAPRSPARRIVVKAPELLRGRQSALQEAESSSVARNITSGVSLAAANPDVDVSAIPDWDFDLVYLWVNGSDPTVLRDKFKYLGTRGVSDRDRDNGELRYSLRSLDQFMPWWNGTLFIVSNQVPCWLDVTHPRVRIVGHKDIFLDPQSTLPNFNSQAIEANVYRIAGLKRHFVLTNDDVFIGAPVMPQDFFMSGQPVLRLEQYYVKGGLKEMLRIPHTQVWTASMYHSRGLLERHFHLQEGREAPLGAFHYLKHAPAALDKDRIRRLWEMFGAEFQVLTHARARIKEGFHLAFLHHSLCVLEDAGCHLLHQRVSDAESVLITSGTNYRETLSFMDVIAARGYKFWNLNDEQDMATGVHNAQFLYRKFLPSLYPVPSQYEMPRGC